MNTRHSLSLTISNASLVIKVLIYTTILLLIGIAIFISVTNPILAALDEDVNLGTEIREDFNAFLSGDKVAAGSLVNGIKTFFSEKAQEVTRAVVLYLVIFIVMKLCVSFSFVPISFVIYNKMSANFNSRYFNAVVAMAGKATMFAVVYTTFTVIADLIILIIAYFLAMWLVNAIGWVGLLLSIALTIAAFALRMSVIGRFIPLMVAENLRFKEAFKRFFRTYNVGFIKEVFPSYLILLATSLGIIATTAVPTIGIIPVLIIPASFVASTSINLVAYFNETSRKYYIDERIISRF